MKFIKYKNKLIFGDNILEIRIYEKAKDVRLQIINAHGVTSIKVDSVAIAEKMVDLIMNFLEHSPLFCLDISHAMEMVNKGTTKWTESMTGVIGESFR